MQVVVLTNEKLKLELLSSVPELPQGVVYLSTLQQLENVSKAEVVIDLLFNEAHLPVLTGFLPGMVIINSVTQTLQATNPGFVRINAWPGFLQQQVIEASAATQNQAAAIRVLQVFNKTPNWLPDVAGFVSARVISAIINEAYLALEDGISTRNEIDTAMKLGTNYPHGPFEWAEKIGTKNIVALLQQLSHHHGQHQAASLLVQSV